MLLCSSLCLLLLASTAAAAGSAASAVQAEAEPADGLLGGSISPESEAVMEWIREHGGEVNIAVRVVPNKGRTLVAPRAFKKGDVLLKVPHHLCYLIRGTEDLWGDALWKELNTPDSPLATFYKALPDRDSVWSLYDIPDEYLPLIQSPELAVERRIVLLQTRFLPKWQPGKGGGGDAAAAREAYLKGTRYAMSLIHTRQFANPNPLYEGMMVPVLDMSNHAHPCTTTYHFHDSCSWPVTKHTAGLGDKEFSWDVVTKRCKIWIANADIAAGTELCNSYRYLTSDMALIQYGFLLQDGRVEKRLARFDRRDFDPADVWGEPWNAWNADNNAEPSDFSTDNATEAAAELARLSELLQALRARDAELARCPVQPHPRDHGGRFLDLMQRWRVQRQAAVQLEIERLLGRLAGLDAGQAAAVRGGLEGAQPAQGTSEECAKLHARWQAAVQGEEVAPEWLSTGAGDGDKPAAEARQHSEL